MGSGTATKRSVAAALIFVGALCLFFVGAKWGSPVNAQAEPPILGDGAIRVIPVQIARDSYGLAMVDTDARTLWIYEINNRGPAHKRLTLLAARSWRYDRLLQMYNTAEPTPERVKALLDNTGQPQQGPFPPGKPDGSPRILEMAEPESGSLDFGPRSK
jgi:hypothetical protein